MDKKEPKTTKEPPMETTLVTKPLSEQHGAPLKNLLRGVFVGIWDVTLVVWKVRCVVGRDGGGGGGVTK